MQTRRHQRGQGIVEFLLVAPLVLLLGLGSIEAIHWYLIRQAVSHALVQAARAASTEHAHPGVLDKAFSQAMLPFYAASNRASSEARLQRAMAKRELASGLPAWHIEILSPAASSFEDFASTNPDLPAAEYAIIDNDYLHEQHETRLAQGWHLGQGPTSGQTTLQANTLRLHLTWLHEPLLPGIKQVVKLLAPEDDRYGSIAMARAGYLPIQRHIAMVMQSHPLDWPMPAHGRISRSGQRPAISHPSIPAPSQAIPKTWHDCQGFWCLSAGEPEKKEKKGSDPYYGESPEKSGSDPGFKKGSDPDYEKGSDPDFPDPDFPDVLDECPGCCD